MAPQWVTRRWTWEQAVSLPCGGDVLLRLDDNLGPIPELDIPARAVSITWGDRATGELVHEYVPAGAQ